MERTEDLLRIVKLYETENSSETNKIVIKESRPSQYLNLAQQVATNIDSNELLVRRMDKLSSRKEFSNDPTEEMTEISDLFHKKVSFIQREFEKLKLMMDNKNQQMSGGQQQMQHYKLLMQALNKRHLVHIESFKTSLKIHSEHVQQRQKRVVKYGQGQDQVRVGVKGGMDNTSQSYAMFSSPSIGNQNMASVQKSQELRRRAPGPAVGSEAHTGISPSSSDNGTNYQHRDHRDTYNGSSSSGRGGGRSAHLDSSRGLNKPHNGQQYMQMQLQEPPKQDTSSRMRVQGAEKVEKAIHQMGHLFTQMATLVMEQSETLARIEDDVEIGLTDTKEGHTSMENLYEITKGNRSMIFKIFILLIFFIFLFLVWT
jgi:syntaxin 5